MTIALNDFALYIHNVRTRMPFRYGIAVMTAVPHLFARATYTVDGRTAVGFAADGLIPKWFTKDPSTAYRDDVVDMLTVIESAFALAQKAGPAASVFELWRSVYEQQEAWAETEGYPALLWNFGVSLMERATIDAFCRAHGSTVAAAVRSNSLGIQLEVLHPALGTMEPAAFLPSAPLRTIRVRHTVGLSDPLTDGDIAPDEAVDDGLPQSLAANIRAYGLRYFKLKLGGDVEADVARLGDIAAVIRESAADDYAFTLDGNEQYEEVAAFQALWDELQRAPELRPFLEHLLFVEQPLHRSVALSEATGNALLAWVTRPPIIIDESDGVVSSVRLALARGYAGTSHKNCKGIFKGIANACLLAFKRRQNPDGRYLLSGEDLANIGPVALLQDLAMMATLGIKHVERNGHHYFAGLSMFPEAVQAAVLAAHADLYKRHKQGFATLRISDGTIAVESAIAAPFGVATPVQAQINSEWLKAQEAWHFDSLAVSQREG